jgi:hydroxymethylbilane synthase
VSAEPSASSTRPPRPSATIATRGSALALWQAQFVKGLLQAKGLPTNQLILKTTGDRVQDRFLHEIGGKGLFVKELEEALLDGRADLAVHSLKDMPAVVSTPFTLSAILPRHAATDVLILRDDVQARLKAPEVLTANQVSALGALTVGTGSLRRQAILRRVAPALSCVGVRGNVDTRLRKLAEGEWDALILAEASLDRLSINGVSRHRLAADWFIPCAGQGALAIESREGDALSSWLGVLACAETTLAVSIERSVLARLGGDCTMPFGCLARRKDGATIEAAAAIYGPNGEIATARHQAPCGDPATFALTGFVTELLDQLRANGAQNVLKALGITKPTQWT